MDIIERLNQNIAWLTRDGFETSAKNLTSAKEEIEFLRQQLAAAKETDLLLRNLLCVIIRDGGHHITAHGLDQSVQDAMKVFYTLRDLPEQLAAALAACELQHKALINTVAHLSAATSAYEKFVGRHGTRGRADALFSTRYADFISAEKRGREALAIKPDASALKQHDEALIERCAAMCDRRTKTVSNGNGICYRSHDPASVAAEYCATAIREMKGTL